jgi:myo-inositol 2-dehydrogenase/D-chiro-inositol 1-dehydrogenase
MRDLVARGMTVFSGAMKMNDGDMRSPPWFSNPSVSGGFIYDTGIHMLDAARWLLGPIHTVRCLARSSCYPDLDDAVMLLATHSGALVTFSTCAHATWTPPTERIELFGDHAAVITEGFDRLIHSGALGRPTVIRDFGTLPWEERLGYVQEDQAFAEAVTKHGTPPVTAEDGYRAVAMVTACYKSAANDGMPVVVG